MPQEESDMTTKIVRHKRARAHRFDDLDHGEWYIGAETGQLYFHFHSPSGKPHLYRFDDNVECTDRYQRAGRFYRADVQVVVELGRKSEDIKPSATAETLRSAVERFHDCSAEERLEVERSLRLMGLNKIANALVGR